jgi:hypothetical protein
MNIYEKLQTCRVGLQSAKLKKSGHNKFSDYDYIELEDFMPTVDKLFLENGLCGIVTFGEKDALLTIYDTTDLKQTVVFPSASAPIQIKGCHEIQNIGATQTYLRRYLYMNAMDIVESDILNAPGSEPAENKKKASENPDEPDPTKIKIDAVKIQTIQAMLRKTNTDEKTMMKFYGVEDDDIKNMTISTFNLQMSALQKKLEKMPEKPKEEPII